MTYTATASVIRGTSRRALQIAAALALPGAALAGPLEVQSSMQVESHVRAADGSTAIKLVPARKVAPGSKVIVSLSYRNTGAQPIANLVLADPVPANLIYRGSHGGIAPELSTDGRSFGPLETLRVTGPAGARPAQAADIRQVRWRLPMPVKPGASGQVSFEAELR
jgi:uncharacterized repeat protein (TIGR01451 family)